MPQLDEASSHAELQTLLEELKLSEDFVEPYFERAKDWYKLTRQFITDTDWPYSNKCATPDTLSFVEDASANIFNTLFGTIPFISWKDQRGFQSSDLTDRLERGTSWMIESRIDEFLLEQYGCQHNKVMYGTSH